MEVNETERYLPGQKLHQMNCITTPFRISNNNNKKKRATEAIETKARRAHTSRKRST